MYYAHTTIPVVSTTEHCGGPKFSLLESPNTQRKLTYLLHGLIRVLFAPQQTEMVLSQPIITLPQATEAYMELVDEAVYK